MRPQAAKTNAAAEPKERLNGLEVYMKFEGSFDGRVVKEISIDAYRICWYVILDTYGSHGLYRG
jgi:hypothetical protein